MKKSVLIVFGVLTILSQMACESITRNDIASNPLEALVSEDIASNTQRIEKPQMKIFSDFIYDVGPRFGAIKKQDLDKATTFRDLLHKDHVQQIRSYTSLSISILDGEKEIHKKETSQSDVFTPAQIKLLQTAPYSSNLKIRADYQEKNIATGQLEANHSTPYLTIVPEKQATYLNGMDVLKKYLKDNSEEARTNVDPEKLQPAKLFFTVTKNGTVENIKLDRSSGYPMVDKIMIELINKTQKSWKPAENLQGDKVDQELVVSFGLLGC
jgi:TonB family protein